MVNTEQRFHTQGGNRDENGLFMKKDYYHGLFFERESTARVAFDNSPGNMHIHVHDWSRQWRR